MYSESLPSHNNSTQWCGFQQWGSDKTYTLVRAAPPAPQHPSPAQTLQHSSNNSELPPPQAVGLVMVGLRQAETELQTDLPNPQGSGLFHSHSASQALNHFPLHYKKIFVFLHHHPVPSTSPTTHPPPLKNITGFNHVNERMFASSDVSTMMSPIKHTHTHTLSDPWCTFHPSQNIPMPKTHRESERGSGSQAHLIYTDTECLLLMDVLVHVTLAC